VVRPFALGIALLLLVPAGYAAAEELPSCAVESARVETLPGSAPLIKRSYRPPNYESLIEYFNEPFTPNDRFFVRSHLANIPDVDPSKWKLEISGESVEHPLSLTLDELKALPQTELAAVALCAGNRRGFFEPHVPGVQWGPGAMGNARWKGVRLKDLLSRAGLKPGALEVVLDGADGPVMEKTPDFVKSLPLAKALDPETLIAWQMNGSDLPKLQGFPARVVVPGWAATYWVKQLTSIRVISKPFDGYWMKSAYRIPKGKFPGLEGAFPTQAQETTVPITEIALASMITNVRHKQNFRPGEAAKLQGLAWDGGHTIRKVEVSTDGGKSWRKASLGKDYGRYSWRQFFFPFKPEGPREYTLKVRATNGLGQTQGSSLVPNPAGYHYNVIQEIQVTSGMSSHLYAHVLKSGTEAQIQLPDGPGKDRMVGNCITCHSLDYIQMNSPFLDRNGWKAEIEKMRVKMGAPISDGDAPIILEYLVTHFGAPHPPVEHNPPPRIEK
jgi:DMSO/TMAO reductase YedYZ molybdopterin-dependent catalytic subunit